MMKLVLPLILILLVALAGCAASQRREASQVTTPEAGQARTSPHRSESEAEMCLEPPPDEPEPEPCDEE